MAQLETIISFLTREHIDGLGNWLPTGRGRDLEQKKAGPNA